MAKDGWHKVYMHEVFVEDGKVKYGVSGSGVTYHTTNPYRYDKRFRCWCNIYGSCSLEAVRAGVKRGTISMM